MAVVATLVTPHQRLTPFTGLPQVARERSGIARAEAVYSSYGTWDSTGAGDSRSINFTFDLDPDYGYVLMDANAAFFQTDSSPGMEAVGFMEIGTDLGPGATEKERQYYQYNSEPSRQSYAGVTPIGDIPAYLYNVQYPCVTSTGGILFGMPIKPTGLLYPFPGVSSIEVSNVFSEAEVQQPAYAYRFFCRFLQYDITQGYHYAVQSPSLTR
jgi:hypothetical protein